MTELEQFADALEDALTPDSIRRVRAIVLAADPVESLASLNLAIAAARRYLEILREGKN